MQLYVLFTLGFPAAPLLNSLTSLHTITRRTVLQKVPHRTYKVLCVLVNIRFQVLFHSPPGVLFTFPSQYCFTIGHQVVFRLGEWSPRLPIEFHVLDGTLDPVCCLPVLPKRLSLALVDFPTSFGYGTAMHCTVLNPKSIATSGLASSAFARHYSQNLVDFFSYGYLDVSVPHVPFA